jgi:tetratricopeptide (TPR) repeat protein
VPDQLVQLDFRKPVTRIAAILLLLIALVWSFFVVRWYIGNTLAEYFNPDENRPDMAQLAVSLAPNDPLTHWRLGDFTSRKLPLDQINQVVAEYEKAVSLSPNDYRYWMSLGRALEQAGEIERGEKALRRTVELAPHYAYPRWYLGNLLIRNDRYAEAFAELQRASEADPQLRPQLFNLAWQVFKDDDEGLKSSVGKSAETRAEFALYLINQKEVDRGLSVWNSLSSSDKVTNRASGEAIITSLAAAAKFHTAGEIWNSVVPGDSYRVAIGQITNGSFESDELRGSPAFGWQLKPRQQVQITLDPNVAHSGSRSLRMVFQVRSKLDALGVTHLILVEPNKQYVLECYVKTAKLESAGVPVISIIDAGTAIATSSPAPTGNNDWQYVNVSFTTGANTQAVLLSISRASCGDNETCPMFGSIWYDDFSLKPGN